MKHRVQLAIRSFAGILTYLQDLGLRKPTVKYLQWNCSERNRNAGAIQKKQHRSVCAINPFWKPAENCKTKKNNKKKVSTKMFFFPCQKYCIFDISSLGKHKDLIFCENFTEMFYLGYFLTLSWLSACKDHVV